MTEFIDTVEPVTPEVVKLTPLQILQSAQAQVEDVLVKAEQTFQLLQQNLTQVSTQRVALSAQKQMLVELISRIKQEESK